MDRPNVPRNVAAVTAVLALVFAGGAAFAQNQNQNANQGPNQKQPQQKAGPANNTTPQAQQAAPGAPQTSPQHVLEGRWFVTWVGRSSASQMVISQIQSVRGVTTFSGQIAAPTGDETCPLTGSVVDQAQISYSDGYEQRNVPLPAIVFVRGQCRNQLIQLELLGMPDGKILMNGRAAIIRAGGGRSYEPVALSRP